MSRMMKQGAEKLQTAASKAAQGASQLKDSFEKNQQAGRDYRKEQNQPQSNPAENADFRNQNPQSVVRPLRLVCRSGEYAGAELELTPRALKISLGTDPTKCNLVFNSPEISRLHCVNLLLGESGNGGCAGFVQQWNDVYGERKHLSSAPAAGVGMPAALPDFLWKISGGLRDHSTVKSQVG